MAPLKEHPTVKHFEANKVSDSARPPVKLEADWLRQLCLDAGADDVGFVEIDRAEIAS